MVDDGSWSFWACDGDSFVIVAETDIRSIAVISLAQGTAFSALAY